MDLLTQVSSQGAGSSTRAVLLGAFAITRTHVVELLFSQPPGDADTGTNEYVTLTRTQQVLDRRLQNSHKFIREQPVATEAVFASGGLVSNGRAFSARIHSGCDCE